MKSKHAQPCLYFTAILMSVMSLSCGKDKATEPELPPGLHFISTIDINYAGSVAVRGSYAFVNGEPGFMSVNIADPANPSIAGSCDTAGIGGTIMIDLPESPRCGGRTTSPR